MTTATAPAVFDTAALAAAVQLADSAPGVRAAASLLRERFAPLKVVVVDAFDMRAETPLATGERVLCWAGASDGHCWQVTPDLGQASGLFLAAKE
ncbi:MAG: hypothetical protein RLY71_548 [Pseudomonadota bacterium]